MNEFDKIKNDYKSARPEANKELDYRKISKKAKAIRLKQNITKIILSFTVVILVGFFIWVSAYKHTTILIGALLMVGSLTIRIIIEMLGTFKTYNKKSSISFMKFKDEMKKYHQKRLQIHYIVTPILFTLYVIGFIILLPFFKEALSNGFYVYVKYSSVVIFIILGLFIYRQIKKELHILKELEQ